MIKHLVSAALLAGFVQASSAATEKDRLDAAIDRALKENRIVGAVVVVARDGKVVYERAAGYADREAKLPMAMGHRFWLASMTKQITSIATLALVEKGVLSLDDAVTKWIPTFRPKLADGREAQITVRHLITHTSGLSYRATEPEGGPYARANVSDGLDQPGLTMAENLTRIGSVPLAFEPGAGWRYSVAIEVLGEVLSRAAGKPLPKVIEETVTHPLKLRSTSFFLGKGDMLVAPYRNTPDAPGRMGENDRIAYGASGVAFSPTRHLDPNSFIAGGAGMFGTARDFLRLLEAIRQGGSPILKRESAEQLIRNQVGSLEGKPWGFGFGVGVLQDPKAVGSPQSVGTYRWGGVLGNSWFVDPSQKLTVVIMTNTATEGLSGPFQRWIRDAVYSKE